MKNRNIQLTAMLFAAALAMVPVVHAAQRLEGGPSRSSGPLITIHSTDNVRRGQTGAFVLNMKPGRFLGGVYVKFSVGGTAVQGADYVVPASPAYIGRSGYAVIPIQTFPDPREPREMPSFGAYSVVITLVDAAGYSLGGASSATMWIKP